MHTSAITRLRWRYNDLLWRVVYETNRAIANVRPSAVDSVVDKLRSIIVIYYLCRWMTVKRHTVYDYIIIIIIIEVGLQANSVAHYSYYNATSCSFSRKNVTETHITVSL